MQGDEKLRKLFGLIKTDKTMGPEYKDATYDEFKDLIVKDVDFRKDLHSDLTKFNIIDPQRTFDDFSKNVELNSGMGTTTAPVPTATAKPVQPAQQPSLTQMTRQQIVTPMKEPQPVKPVEPEKEKSGFGVIPFVTSAIKSVKGFFGNEIGIEKGKKVAVNPSPLKSYEEAQTQYRNADKQFQELEKNSKSIGAGGIYSDYDFGTQLKLSKEIPGLKTNAEKSLLGAGPTIDKIINDAYKNADESKFMDYNPSTKKRIVSLDKIQNLSRQIAKQSGLPETGYAQQRIASQMKAYVEHKQIEPDVEKEVYKLLGNQTPKNLAQKEFEKVVKENTKIQGLKTQAEIEQKVVADQLNVEQKTITSQYEKDYKTLVADLNKESAADPEIETLRKTIIAEDKQTAKQIHEKYQQLVNSGKMTVIQATAARDKEYELFNDPKKLEEKKERINALAKQKFGAKYANAFQQYTNAMNATSTRFNRRYKREAGEIVGLANAKINAELEAVKKQYKTSPETVAKIEAAYKEAYGKVLKEKDLKEYAVDQSLGFWNQIANSTISSFGAGVSGYATTFGLGKVAQLGDVISNNFHPSNIAITTAGDWLDPIKAAHGTGDLLGRMVPSIVVGAATAAATQGAGVPMAARLMLTGFADMMAESADISGTIYKQMLDKTGSAVDAGNAARDAFEGNLYNYPAYVVGSLPFFKNALKGVPGLTGVFGRTAFGAGLEMVSETYTESVQGAQEKSILAGERLKDTFKELTIDHILETGVQMGPIAILGGAPHLFQGGRDVIEKNFADRAVNAFRAKEVLSTELNDENQAQFFAQIHNEKGAAFAKSMLGSLFIDGKITPEQNERLSTFINNYDNWSPQAKKLGLNGTGAKIGGILFNDLEQARASADPQLIKEAQSAFDNFLKTGNAELISVGLSDGSTYFYKPGEFSRMLDTPDFQKLIQDGSVKLSGMSSNMGTGEYKSLIEKVDMVGKAARPTAPLAPTQEQIEDDIKNKRFATFTYETEDQVPDELKDKISSRGDINGKPFVKVTIPQSQADYILAQQKQAEMESDTEFVTATPEELEAYRNGTLTDQDRIAGINDDALKIEQGAQTLEDLPDDPNYREMVRLKLAENQAAPAAQQGAGQNVSLENRVKETENKIKNKNLFLAEVDENGNRVIDKQTGRQSQSVGEIISQSDDAPVPTSVREINGIEFVEFSNPRTGDVDVIVTGKNDGSYVGYYRLYNNGKPTNQWSSKFENPSRNKEDFKTMISGVQSMLPEGHEYTEKTSISTDGLRVWNQQLNRGYQLQYDGNGNVITNKVAINGDAIVNELGIDVDKGSFENISVRNNADIKKVKQALLPYLQKLGLNESNLHFQNGTVYIDLPVLKKSTNQAAATSQQTNQAAPLPAAEASATQQGTNPGVAESGRPVVEGENVSAAPLAGTTFKTAKGSVYTYLPDGRTQRFKTATNEQNEPQDLTVFVKFKDAEQEQDFLEGIQRSERFGTKVYLIDQQGNKYDTNEQAAGKDVRLVLVKDGKVIDTVETSLTPQIGYNTFDQRRFKKDGENYREAHLGNKVTEINPASETTPNQSPAQQIAPKPKPNPFIEKTRKAFNAALKKLGLKAKVKFISDEEAAEIVASGEPVKAMTAGFQTRDGKPIGFAYDTDQVARGRFDFSKLKKIGSGSDRDVYDLGDGKVLKVAKTARGLTQNIYEGDFYLKGIIPEVFERGLNYVVAENTPRMKAADKVPTYYDDGSLRGSEETASYMLNELKDFDQRDFDRKDSVLQSVLTKYGLQDIMSYEVLWGDFIVARNWGYKDGKAYHSDGGTFGGVDMIDSYKNKTNLSDPEFRKIYEESKRLKKQFGDTDKNTMYMRGPSEPSGIPLTETDLLVSAKPKDILENLNRYSLEQMVQLLKQNDPNGSYQDFLDEDEFSYDEGLRAARESVERMFEDYDPLDMQQKLKWMDLTYKKKTPFTPSKFAQNNESEEGGKVVPLFMKDSKGTILGFVQPQPDGSFKVWIDPATTNAETPIHELAGHIFMPLLKEAAPELHAKGVELIQGTSYMDNAKALGLEGAAASEEALAQAIGEKGKQLTESKRKDFLDWLNGMWKKIGEKLGITKPIKDLTLEEFTDLIAGSIVFGKQFEMKGEAGRDARAELKDNVGPEEFKRMEDIHRNGEKMLKELEGKGLIKIDCP